MTGGLVPEVLPPEAVTDATAFVVTDAVSLRARWETPFPLYDTRPRPFTLSEGSEVQVPTMRLRRVLPFYRGEGFVAVDIPYRGGYFAMTLLVPDNPDGLPALEGELSPNLLADVSAAERGEEVVLYLPRFSIEADLPLEGVLMELGATVPFDPLLADFSGAAGEPRDIFLSVFRQRAVIRVTEAGTVAAAVTAAVGELTSAPPVVAADRPFLFLIRHRASGMVLFMGRVVDPR